MAAEPTVFVVDDDPSMVQTFCALVESAGLTPEAFGTAEDFLGAYQPTRPGCLVLDFRLPGLTGLDLLEEMAGRGMALPVIMVSGDGDTSLAARAMKNGAFDFLRKPVNGRLLLDRIWAALFSDAEQRRTQTRCAEPQGKVALLTRREREVLNLIVAGKTNEQIAAQLAISRKTVTAHRAQVMRKTGADSVADLIRVAELATPSM
jgi:FixJ family two-component response regulator